MLVGRTWAKRRALCISLESVNEVKHLWKENNMLKVGAVTDYKSQDR